MKICFTFLTFLFISFVANGQINVTYDSNLPVGERLVKVTSDPQAAALNPSTAIQVNINGLPNGVTASIISSFNGVNRSSGNSPSHTLAGLSSIEISSYASYILLIKTMDGNETSTYNNIASGGTGKSATKSTINNSFPENNVSQEIGSYFHSLNITDFGLEVASSIFPNYPYIGSKYSHIFLDQFGNSLIGSIPQGISNRQYVVHIIYLANKDNPSQISYSVRQTKGEFNSTLVFNNAGQLGGINVQAGKVDSAPSTTSYEWAHQEFLLRTSTNDVEFEISRNILEDQPSLSLQRIIVGKHTIQMSKVFHGSFDIGFINSKLANPSYELVPSSTDPEFNFVKRCSASESRGIVTAMATFYTSPIILLEKYLFGIDIPNYKLTGRNFLDDHKIYERIYPAVGVAINEQTFKNLFFGLNWEIARGAAFFAGIHYGEVNTFRIDNDFEFERTMISETDFILRKNKAWNHNFAFGANLDILVVTNLFIGN